MSDRVPPTLTNYTVHADLLDATATFLRERGLKGVEGVVLWLGRVLTDTDAEIVEAYIPAQKAYRSVHGLAVSVDRTDLSRLIRELPHGLFVLARVHSHGEEAYHSSTDDHNMLIAHPGAISIVVPHFAADGLDLLRCSVNELVHGSGWRELSVEEVKERFTTLTTTPDSRCSRATKPPATMY